MFSRFALLACAVALLLAFGADVAVHLLAMRLGGFGVMATRWGWVRLASAWWATSLFIAWWCGGKLHVFPFGDIK